MLGAGETLLKQYVMLQSERLGALVKKSLAVSDWLTRKEPRDARPVVDIVIGEVAVIAICSARLITLSWLPLLCSWPLFVKRLLVRLVRNLCACLTNPPVVLAAGAAVKGDTTAACP